MHDGVGVSPGQRIDKKQARAEHDVGIARHDSFQNIQYFLQQYISVLAPCSSNHYMNILP